MITQVKFFESAHLSYLETTVNEWIIANAMIQNVSVNLTRPFDKNDDYIATITYNTHKTGKIIVSNGSEEDVDDPDYYDQ